MAKRDMYEEAIERHYDINAELDENFVIDLGYSTLGSIESQLEELRRSHGGKAHVRKLSKIADDKITFEKLKDLPHLKYW